MKDVKFDFDDKCLHAFQVLKEKLVTTPMVVRLYWFLQFELISDASDAIIGEI